jgi:hypothetical protein
MSAVAFFARLAWMLFGPFILMVSAFMLAGQGKGSIALNVVYFVTLGAMLLGRWAEFRSGHAVTAEGVPAPAGCLRRYLIGATAIALAIWIAAHVIANFTPTG